MQRIYEYFSWTKCGSYLKEKTIWRISDINSACRTNGQASTERNKGVHSRGNRRSKQLGYLEMHCPCQSNDRNCDMRESTLKKPQAREESALMSTISRECHHHLHGTSPMKCPCPFLPPLPPAQEGLEISE